ncbi:hypothetical protein P7K49_020984 [Saguinus oedipus]|uniref:Uncharacterized protein n=1 Tax=Saguinus oedipus TaxID=9490 RepID=A0ABQ9US19_SAGOE|nr:hypothetical protein P7K49_020984 [Saguinus oedipus]
MGCIPDSFGKALAQDGSLEVIEAIVRLALSWPGLHVCSVQYKQAQRETIPSASLRLQHREVLPWKDSAFSQPSPAHISVSPMGPGLFTTWAQRALSSSSLSGRKTRPPGSIQEAAPSLEGAAVSGTTISPSGRSVTQPYPPLPELHSVWRRDPVKTQKRVSSTMPLTPPPPSSLGF